MQRYEHGGDVYACTGRPEYDYSVNLNPLGIPQAVKNVLKNSVDSFAAYPDPHCREFRAKLGEYLNLPPENILAGSGASDLITRICSCLRPKQMLTLAPTFSEYERTAKLYGANVREHRLKEENGFELTESILDDITDDLDLMFICSPNNPTGKIADRNLMQRILEKCREKSVVLVVDECFLDFTEAQSLQPLLPEYKNLILLRAFTKIYSIAGLRLGYILGDAELLSKIEKYGSEWAVSTPAQLAGLAALTEEPGWSEQTRAFVKEERTFVTNELRAIGLKVYDSASNFLLIRGRAGLVEELLARGFMVRPANNFTGLNDEYFRIGVKDRASDKKLINALKEILHG